MAELVTIEQATRHLRLVEPDDDLDLQLKIDQATAIILDYLDRDDATWSATMAAWTRQTVPPQVQAAILLQLGELYRFRGDDEATPDREHGFLAPGVVALLHRLRDPALA